MVFGLEFAYTVFCIKLYFTLCEPLSRIQSLRLSGDPDPPPMWLWLQCKLSIHLGWGESASTLPSAMENVIRTTQPPCKGTRSPWGVHSRLTLTTTEDMAMRGKVKVQLVQPEEWTWGRTFTESKFPTNWGIK